MGQIIDAREALQGTPRPHYLFGKAAYSRDGTRHSIRGQLNFISVDEHPSIVDRNKLYLKHPHVNAGDVCFAVWNAAHIIGDILGYDERTLVNRILVTPVKVVPPDTPLDIEAIVTPRATKQVRSPSPCVLGSIEGRISLNEDLLTKVEANYFARFRT